MDLCYHFYYLFEVFMKFEEVGLYLFAEVFYFPFYCCRRRNVWFLPHVLIEGFYLSEAKSLRLIVFFRSFLLHFVELFMDVWIFPCYGIFLTCLHIFLIFLFFFFMKVNTNSIAILMSEEVRKCIAMKLLILPSLFDISQSKVKKYTRTFLLTIVLVILNKLFPNFILIDPTTISVLLQFLHKTIFWIVSIIFQICMKCLLSLPQFNHIIS